MRNIFQRIPFLRITSLFLSGILIQHFYHPNFHITAVLLTALLILLLLFWHNTSFTSVRIQNVVLSVSIIVSGIFYPINSIGRKISEFNQKEYFLAEVCQNPAEKAKIYQTVLILENDNHSRKEKVVAYFSKSSFNSSIKTGDQLIILAKPQLIKNAGNPYEFDYRKIMEDRRITHSVYLDAGTYLKTGKQIRTIGNLAEITRDKLITKFPEILPNREERSVVSALTLGYRTEIAQDTLDYFASTGAMHVLSVSGLHVALIYMILGFFLSFLKKGKSGRLFFLTVMIVLLWSYAFISGFSPPVQRATMMFTFVIIGENMRRPVNIYNSLSASALFLMLINPNVLFDVGFQLSYLAILGIVLIQPVLFESISLTNRILRWTWSLFTVSVAAQLVTFPLGIFYFNQFPNLFWLSNFVVVPVTTLIMWLSFAFFAFIPIHSLALLSGMLIQKSTSFMLNFLKLIDAHPLAVTKGIVLSTGQTWLLYAIIVAALLLFFSKQKQWLYLGLSLIVAIQLTSIISKIQLKNQRHIFVYNTRNPMIHLINARNNYILSADSVISDYDMRAAQKVIDHLKLNNPIVINKWNEAKYDDLVIEKSTAQFLDYQLEFPLKESLAQVKICPLSDRTGNTDSSGITVYSSLYRFNSDKTSNQKFCTKTDGAFHLNFRK